jgi:hypothetical protein
MPDVITTSNDTYVNVGDMAVTELLTSLTSAATVDVTIASANTWYSTGASITLAVGTWLVIGRVTVGRTATTALTYTARIRDTTNNATLDETQHYHASAANHYVPLPLQAVVTVASGTPTVRLEATANQGTTSVIKANLTVNGTGTSKATNIIAVKIG